MKFLPCIVLFLIFGCGQKRPAEQSASPASATGIKYAEGFKISTVGNAKLVEVTHPFQGSSNGYTYLLVPRGEAAPPHDNTTKVIYIPLETIVCTSTTHVPLLDYLNQTERLTGFPSTDYISSEKMRKRIDQGEVQDLGIDKGLNLEVLAMLKPDLVMGYTLTGDYGQFRKIEALGIPVVMNAEYLEKHPLGRAEWIKFMAMFFNKETMADSIFNAIEQNYLDAKATAALATTRPPTVLSGIIYGDAWFLPGGENYAAKLFKDARADYLWAQNSSNGYLQLSFESVYEKAYNADLWIGTGSYKNLKEIQIADYRYTRFQAFQNRHIYNYDKRLGAKGGNEYLELGYLRPDMILKDLVKIANPNLLPDHDLFFHRRLDE